MGTAVASLDEPAKYGNQSLASVNVATVLWWQSVFDNALRRGSPWFGDTQPILKQTRTLRGQS